jgi:trehalose 2-sulfotransferase
MEAAMQPHSSYLICATPRSGSTLLCEALTNTGIAGYPKEYFEALKETGLPRRPREYFETLDNMEIVELLGEYSQLDEESFHPAFWNGTSFASYLVRVLEEGTTPNGVFGAKVMWGYFDDFIINLRQIPGYRDMPVSGLLATAFPNLQYIWVTRADKVRQAISLWKAIQTWTWKMEESVVPAGRSSPSAHKLVFHFGAIDHLVQQLEAHEASWQQYFNMCGVKPLTIMYEELSAAYEVTSLKVLQYLKIPIPENLVLSEQRMKKQSDALSEEWVQQYYDLKLK